MIELTVRTLDSQNHQFSVDDEITVAHFKEHIAETVNIPADTQRIIYCGRVLTDESKLKDFDVNGKVVHLVQRAPPSENQTGDENPPTTNPQPTSPNRVLGQNAMYLSSMAIPLEQNLVPPPPSFSLASSRLNVARRMLRRAEAILNQLENPATRPSDTAPAEEQEEVTPVYEARVTVPTTSNEPIDEAFVLNAVQNSLSNAIPPSTSQPVSQPAAPDSGNEPSEQTTSAQTSIDTETPASTSPDGIASMSTSTEDLAAEPREATAQPTAPAAETSSRTVEFAELLEHLSRLQVRLTPFLASYEDFMRNDPVVAEDDMHDQQNFVNRVSEVLHFFGHAYHSLSDIIVRIRNDPPRALLCRPILIQHSAVLQGAFPISVEAQINFSQDSAPPNNGPPNNAQPNTTATAPTSNTPTNAPQSNQNIPNQPPRPAGHNITINPNLFGFPLMQSGGVHVQSFPIGIRTIRTGNARTNTGNTPASRGPNQQSANQTANQQSANQQNANPQNVNEQSANPNTSSETPNNNVEFFMEVTPESITIDSLETTLLGNNSQGEGVRPDAPPPELIQSIVQIANHLVNRGGQVENQNQTGATRPQSTSATTESTPQGANAGQNSQARGNTQTNPTTATHTRSTARPHVHLAQHAMQGFDPFLPCSSHHTMFHRRRLTPRSNATNNNQTSNNNARAQNGNTNSQFNPVLNIVQGVLNSIQTMYNRRGPVRVRANPMPPTWDEMLAGEGPTSGRIYASFPRNVPQAGNVPRQQQQQPRGPTIAQLLFADHWEGEGIFNDLIMFLSRNFTIADMLQMNTGGLDPLMRIRCELRTFILDRILHGCPTQRNVDRAVNTIITEMEPFLRHLNRLEVNDNIDIVRSIKVLLRTRLPNIIHYSVSRAPNAIKLLVDYLKLTTRHFCALILHASRNGPSGVEEVLSHILTTYMDSGITAEMQEWTQMATRAQLQQFLSTLNVPLESLRSYIMQNVDSNTTVPETMDVDANPQVGVDGDQAGGSTSVLNLDGLPEDEVPAIVLGNENWHGQVPADWVPIITRDSQRQRRANTQSPLSDAYLSGMPSKRRKIVTKSKPQGSLPQVITESIKQAVAATGLGQIANVETVAQEAGADISIQSAYRDLLRARVQSTVQDNEDFTPDRFPNASNYFNKSQ